MSFPGVETSAILTTYHFFLTKITLLLAAQLNLKLNWKS